MRRALSITLAAALAAAPAAGAAVQERAYVTAIALTFVPGDLDEPRAPLELEKGKRLTFVSLDVLGYHTLTSVQLDAYGRPIFDSGEQIGPGQTAEVQGVEDLAAGSYLFFCVTHGLDIMAGRLDVTEP
jgi:plastocyanin